MARTAEFGAGRTSKSEILEAEIPAPSLPCPFHRLGRSLQPVTPCQQQQQQQPPSLYRRFFLVVGRERAPPTLTKVSSSLRFSPMTSVLLSALEQKRSLIFCMHRKKSPRHRESFSREGNKAAALKRLWRATNLFTSKGLCVDYFAG